MEQRDEKKQVLSEALDGAPTVFLHLDARRAGVKVPENHGANPQLILRVGYMLTPPINLDLGDEAVTCTLSFNRAPFFCVIPWDAIYAVVGDDGRAAVWPDDIPPEAARLKEAVHRTPSLSAVPSPSAESEGATTSPAPASPRPRPMTALKSPLGPKPKAAPAGKRNGRPKERRIGEPHATVRERPVHVSSAPTKNQPPPRGDDESSSGVQREIERDTPAPAAERKPKRELPPYLRVIK